MGARESLRLEIKIAEDCLRRAKGRLDLIEKGLLPLSASKHRRAIKYYEKRLLRLKSGIDKKVNP
jgi:hypothetical protein